MWPRGPLLPPLMCPNGVFFLNWEQPWRNNSLGNPQSTLNFRAVWVLECLARSTFPLLQSWCSRSSLSRLRLADSDGCWQLLSGAPAFAEFHAGRPGGSFLCRVPYKCHLIVPHHNCIITRHNNGIATVIIAHSNYVITQSFTNYIIRFNYTNCTNKR